MQATGLALVDRVLGDGGAARLELSWREGRVAAPPSPRTRSFLDEDILKLCSELKLVNPNVKTPMERDIRQAFIALVRTLHEDFEKISTWVLEIDGDLKRLP